jgi:predicted transcriptional regulator
MSGLKSTRPSVQGPWCAVAFAGAAHRAWPASTAWYVARATGQSVRTVEKHLRGEAKPGADALIAYLRSRHLGPRLREALHINEGTAPDQDSAGD